MRLLTEILEQELTRSLLIHQQVNVDDLDASVVEALKVINQQVNSKVKIEENRVKALIVALQDYECGLKDGYNRRKKTQEDSPHYVKGYRMGYSLIDSISKRRDTQRNTTIYRQLESVMPVLRQRLNDLLIIESDPEKVLLVYIGNGEENQQTAQGIRGVIQTYRGTTRELLNGCRINVTLDPRSSMQSVDMHVRQGLIDAFNGWGSAADYEFAQAEKILMENPNRFKQQRYRQLLGSLQLIHSGEIASMVLLEAYRKFQSIKRSS